MSCVRPLSGWRGPGGVITMTFKQGYSDLPAEVACGQCIECRKERARGWAIRCCHEAHMSQDSQGVERSSFITLTYSDQHLPADHSVDTRHWQLFAKRLRKRLGPFRFLHCGEYGDKYKRPHYHAILFGIDFAGDRVPYETTSAGHQTFTSPTLDEIWGKGICYIGSVSFDSAAYVAGYILKKISGPPAEAHYQRHNEHGEVWSVKPEYSTMSRRPGLGTSFFERYVDDIYPSDTVVINGKVMKPPRFYDDLLEQRDPDLYEYVLQNRREKINGKDQTWERRRVREIVKEAEFSHFHNERNT